MSRSRAATILLVDDNPGDILLARKAFERAAGEAQLEVATDGEQALDYLRGCGEAGDRPRPDLVLLDINLPRLSGLEVLQAIKREPALRRIPVVMLTSSDRDLDVHSAYDNHANSYVTKPSNMTALVALFDELQQYWLEVVQPCPSTI